jgi:hypothetical protein
MGLSLTVSNTDDKETPTMTTRLSGLVAAILTALLVLIAGPAHAQYPVETGDLETTSSSATAGASVGITGGGCVAGTTATLTLEPGGTSLGTTTATITGDIAATVAVPQGTPAGTYTIRATCPSPTGTLVLSSSLVVTAAGGTGATGGTGSLADTGRSVGAALALAGILGGAGYGMVLVSRRVRHS